jgi:hypothetical protein
MESVVVDTGVWYALALALTWRREPRMKTLVAFSRVMFGLVWVAIVLNLSFMDSQGALWVYLQPIYGLVQRSLFVAWFVWCAGAGLLLLNRERRSQ